MTNKYWFKPKKYGIGAMPSSWEGWSVILIFSIVAIYTAINFANDLFKLIIILFILIIILIFITKKKTDGEWKWRWENKSK